MSEEVNRALYRRFADAWAAGDVAALMAFVADDIVYGASVGPEPGATWRGKMAVEQGFRAIMRHDGGQAPAPREALFVGDRGFILWSAGAVKGIDVVTFRDGLIAVKDAYRKALP